MSDICSLILPRPIFIESGEKDIIFPIEVVKKSVLALKKRGSVEQPYIFRRTQVLWRGDGRVV